NVAEQVVALGELLRVVDSADEELAAIRILPGVRHRHGARRVLAEDRLVGEFVTRSAAARPERVAALDDKARFDTVELQAVVKLVARQEDEVVDGVRGQFGVETEG